MFCKNFVVKLRKCRKGVQADLFWWGIGDVSDALRYIFSGEIEVAIKSGFHR